MVAYVTKNYDFGEAIDVGLNRVKGTTIIKGVNEINDNSCIVNTDFGNFYCESFEDKNANVYMKVFPIL
jgi:hypothetical protein